MGVAYVSPWKVPAGQNVQQNIEELHNSIEQLGAIKTGLFTVECESYHAVNVANSKTLHLIHSTEYPASRFACFEDGPSIVSDVMLPSFLSKLRSVWQPRKGGRIESKGHRYELGDFVLKTGIISMGPSTKGISLEVEYTPCVYPCDCWGIITELLKGFVGENMVTNMPTLILEKSKEIYTPDITMQQYVELFSNIRKSNLVR
ncbi:mediator of RNA polymerase II transcription subunit 20-like [Ciona intestinalis]